MARKKKPSSDKLSALMSNLRASGVPAKPDPSAFEQIEALMYRLHAERYSMDGFIHAARAIKNKIEGNADAIAIEEIKRWLEDRGHKK